MLSTYELFKYMDARRIDDTTDIIDAPEDDPVLLQAEADGYADRHDGYWIARGHIKDGERRLVRFMEESGGGEQWIVGGEEDG